MLKSLTATYEKERKQAPESIHALLDYYQYKYITGAITINNYREIFACLHREGAVSAYENRESEQSSL